MQNQIPNKRSGTTRRAFTLLELLIVITILAILAAILLPVFSTARKRAQEQMCASNLRQIGIALEMYAIDYDDQYPYSISALNKKSGDGLFGFDFTPAQIAQIPTAKECLLPYLKDDRVFACPLDFGGQIGLYRTTTSYYETLGESYSFTTLLRDESPGCIQEPSRYVYANDYTGEWHSAPNTYILSRKQCQLFYDGHVVCGIPDPKAPSYLFSPCEKPFNK